MEKISPFFYASFSTPLGDAIIGWYQNRLSAFILPQDSFEKALQILNSYQLPPHASKITSDELPWPDLPDKINSYFQGEAVSFPEPIYIEQFQPFTIQVLNTIHDIPWGKSMTYQQVAQIATQSKAYRAVGQALGRNPIPLIIPCHRVVAKNSLGGFGYGLDWKARLLTLEKYQGIDLNHYKPTVSL